MKKLARKLTRRLPRRARIALYRTMTHLEVPRPIDKLRFSVVRSIDELIPVYRLLYRGFRESSYAPANTAELHLSPYFLLDSTYTIVATLDGTPVASLSVLLDNPHGLPADTLVDLDVLRRGGRIAEIGSLCIAPEYRHLSQHLLFRFAIFSFRIAILLGSHRYTVSRSSAVLTDFYCACFGWRYLTTGAVVDSMTNGQRLHVSAFDWNDAGDFYHGQPCTIEGRRSTLYDAAVTVDLEDMAIPSSLSDLPLVDRKQMLDIFLTTRKSVSPLELQIIRSNFDQETVVDAGIPWRD